MTVRIMRSVAAALAALSLTLGVAGAVLAADPSPGLIGGRLQAGDHRVILTSTATVPVRVTMAADFVTLSETSFLLGPGETHDLTYSGEHKGNITARLDAIQTSAGDVGSLTLGVNLALYNPPPDFRPFLFLALLIVGGALLLRRVKPWQFRLTRKEAA